MKKILFFVSLFITTSLMAIQSEDWDTIKTTVAEIKGEQTWEDGSEHPNTPLGDAIMLTNGKYYKDLGGQFRYYHKSNKGQFTIRATKAGVIIQSVKLTYTSDDKTFVAKVYSSTVEEKDIIKSDKVYSVNDSAVTYYTSKTGDNTSGNYRVFITGYEIRYFDPSKGVAVTKTANDLGWDLGLEPGFQDGNKNIKFNNVLSVQADKNGTLKYFSNSLTGNFNCYVHTGPIYISARPGTIIHYVKISYNSSYNCILTKTWGENGFEIPLVDQIASDSILYVNSDSLKLYIGNQNSFTSGAKALSITKIYVNYTDTTAIVENFDSCTVTSSVAPVKVAGVGGRFNWVLSDFSRGNADRMYYNQSVKLNKGGQIATEFTGGLKEVAFDWHPSYKDKKVKFTVTAGDSVYVVDSAAMANAYTINFLKKGIKSEGEFSIKVDNASDTAVDFGHISLIPYYISYTTTSVSLDAGDYKEAGYKYTNSTLISNADKGEIVYSVEGENADKIASVDAETGEVTLLGEGTVTVKAAVGKAYSSYELNIDWPEDPGTELESQFTDSPVDRCTKFLYNEQLIIIRNGVRYNANGQML